MQPCRLPLRESRLDVRNEEPYVIDHRSDGAAGPIDLPYENQDAGKLHHFVRTQFAGGRAAER
jgi:hypothetical protein